MRSYQTEASNVILIYEIISNWPLNQFHLQAVSHWMLEHDLQNKEYGTQSAAGFQQYHLYCRKTLKISMEDLYTVEKSNCYGHEMLDCHNTTLHNHLPQLCIEQLKKFVCSPQWISKHCKFLQKLELLQFGLLITLYADKNKK